jgi:HEAT repeat protein
VFHRIAYLQFYASLVFVPYLREYLIIMLTNDPEKVLTKLIRQLESDDLHKRVKAIKNLGDIGDESCLHELRNRMKYLHDEYMALIIAIGKLKKRLRVK